MKQTMKKTISLLLVLVQLFVLFPVLQPQAAAAQSEPETPVLNKTIVGTVKFQSFNFLGDNATGSDGVDYTSTFYYTDDFFSPSAIHETNSVSLKWSDLTPNELSLAATSFDLTVAAYASNENNVLTATTRSWDNTYYPGKDKNAKAMLEACGFTNFESYGTYNQAPTNDSIAYSIASKSITVWDEASQSNKDFTLIAVAVRGAGYGAEWASNVTIGNKNTNQLPANGRHWGFDDAAAKVCAGIRSYLAEHNITSDAKYWITGFSRAGATANLVAGYVTDGAESTYYTHQRDVYGFTWECPKGAAKSETALNYKNIHNILNPMDAVPKVSPDAFQHQRLGVDYEMPYYGNTTNAAKTNTEYYTTMREVLKTIAVGANNYAGETYTEDPLISVTDPTNYPYNRPMTIRTITPTQLISDALNDNLMKNFGTVSVSGSDNKLGTNVYIDKFIDNLIDVFLKSKAWIGQIGGTRTALQNRTTFISDFQNDFRNVLGYLLDYSGPAFLGMVDALIDAVGDQLSISNTVTNAGLGLAFLNFYEYPTSTYKWGVPPFIDPWVGSPSWAGQTRRAVLISEAQPVVKNVIRNMVGAFDDPQGITRETFEKSMDHLVELVVNLYADELSKYNSNYFGTSLYYMWQILCTHEQEVVMSWIKSLDPNHMNRSCRTITLPAGCDATLYEYREQYAQYEGSMDDMDAKAPVVAELKNGALDSKDGRITLYQENGSYVIRYPASLQIRVDLKPNQTISLNSIAVDDYETRNAYTAVSDGESQFLNKPLYNTYNTITQLSDKTNAAAQNTALNRYGMIGPGDTLHVLVSGMQTFNSGDTVYDLLVDKAPSVSVLNYAAGGAGGTRQTSAFNLGVSTADSVSTDNSRSILTRQRNITVPASSVYFDDELTGNSTSGYAADTTRLDNSTENRVFWYKFRGTRIDAYCTTDDTAGYVQAAVTDENGNIVTNAAGERMIVTMKSASDTTRYNVPTISFDGLNSDTDYYLKITALKGANYRLDGIRVYHSADETDSAVKTAYESVGEQNANYVNLRALLLGSVNEDTLNGDVAEGAVFYTDSGTSYALTSDEYVANSPKNEIYLKNGESVAFQIVGTYEKVAVGLSAPDTETGGGSVTVTNGSGTKTQPIANALDTYYEINPATDGSVVIENTGSAMISITNVKLSGDYTAPVSGQSLDVPLTVSKSLIRYAASFSTLADTTPAETAVPEETTAPTEEPAVTQTPEPTPSPTPAATPEPTPTPTNPSSDSSVMQLISSFVKSLFGGFSRLFRP